MLTPTLGQLPDYGALDWSVPLAHAIHRSARGVPPRMSGRLHLEYLQALRLGKALTSAFARNRAVFRAAVGDGKLSVERVVE